MEHIYASKEIWHVTEIVKSRFDKKRRLEFNCKWRKMEYISTRTRTKKLAPIGDVVYDKNHWQPIRLLTRYPKLVNDSIKKEYPDTYQQLIIPHFLGFSNNEEAPMDNWVELKKIMKMVTTFQSKPVVKVEIYEDKMEPGTIYFILDKNHLFVSAEINGQKIIMDGENIAFNEEDNNFVKHQISNGFKPIYIVGQQREGFCASAAIAITIEVARMIKKNEVWKKVFINGNRLKEIEKRLHHHRAECTKIARHKEMRECKYCGKKFWPKRSKEHHIHEIVNCPMKP